MIMVTSAAAFSIRGSARFFRHSVKAHAAVGDCVPAIKLFEGQADYKTPVEIDLNEILKGKTVVVFAVPGAFTPGCSKSHLPSFISSQKELRAAGVDTIICTATNGKSFIA